MPQKIDNVNHESPWIPYKILSIHIVALEISLFRDYKRKSGGGMFGVGHQKLQSSVKISFHRVRCAAYTGHRSLSKAELIDKAWGKTINCLAFVQFQCGLKKYQRNARRFMYEMPEFTQSLHGHG